MLAPIFQEVKIALLSPPSAIVKRLKVPRLTWNWNTKLNISRPNNRWRKRRGSLIKSRRLFEVEVKVLFNKIIKQQFPASSHRICTPKKGRQRQRSQRSIIKRSTEEVSSLKQLVLFSTINKSLQWFTLWFQLRGEILRGAAVRGDWWPLADGLVGHPSLVQGYYLVPDVLRQPELLLSHAIKCKSI